MRTALWMATFAYLAALPCACVDYDSDPCRDVDCALFCYADVNCADAGRCVFTHDGCCSHCAPSPCDSADDCPACNTCEGDPGQCVPIPCPAECVSDDDCPPDEHCETNPPGCCGTCLPDNPCAGLDCLATCVSDYDCPPEALCVYYENDCCSMCFPTCEGCRMSAGEYCPGQPPDDLCEIGRISVVELGPCIFSLTYSGDAGDETVYVNGCSDLILNLDNNACGLQYVADTDTFLVACNWCGQVPYTQAYCDCVPDCRGRHCGPDGCGGLCGSCPEGCTCSDQGQCLGCPLQEVELVPSCVHAPYLVGAGGSFPLAVFGEIGCAWFDLVDVRVDGFDIDVTLIGSADPAQSCPQLEVCPGDMWTYIGLIWLPAPNPGPYTITVADAFVLQVVASGGIIEEPACQDDCAYPPLEGTNWTLSHLSSWEVAGSCGGYLNAVSDLIFDGSCQNYTVVNEDWTFPTQALHCNDGQIFFGTQAVYPADATVCPVTDPASPIRILGIANQGYGDPAAEVFLIEAH